MGGISERVRKPWATGPPNGLSALQRSTSTWIHWWSSVSWANVSIISCDTCTGSPKGPNSSLAAALMASRSSKRISSNPVSVISSPRVRSVAPEHHGAHRAEEAAGGVHAGDASIVHLAIAGLAPQLAHGLDQQEHPPHPGVARGQPAAVRVHRQRSAGADGAGLDEGTTLADGAEPEPLEREE